MAFRKISRSFNFSILVEDGRDSEFALERALLNDPRIRNMSGYVLIDSSLDMHEMAVEADMTGEELKALLGSVPGFVVVKPFGVRGARMKHGPEMKKLMATRKQAQPMPAAPVAPPKAPPKRAPSRQPAPTPAPTQHPDPFRPPQPQIQPQPKLRRPRYPVERPEDLPLAASKMSAKEKAVLKRAAMLIAAEGNVKLARKLRQFSG